MTEFYHPVHQHRVIASKERERDRERGYGYIYCSGVLTLFCLFVLDSCLKFLSVTC